MKTTNIVKTRAPSAFIACSTASDERGGRDERAGLGTVLLQVIKAGIWKRGQSRLYSSLSV